MVADSNIFEAHPATANNFKLAANRPCLRPTQPRPTGRFYGKWVA